MNDRVLIPVQKGETLNELKGVLLKRLEKKGVQPEVIPGFIRSVARVLSDRNDVNFKEINEKLHLLGWNDFELDDHTLQLIIANFEADELAASEIATHL